MTSIVVISAGLSTPSSTRLLADRLAEAVGAAAPGASVEHIELRPLAHQLTDQLITGFPGPELAAAQNAVRAADGLVVITPVFAASYSGLFKMFFDVLEPETIDGTPVLIAATAGTARHSLVLEHALRPLFSYLHAVVVPTGVFAATEDFASAELTHRITRATRELVGLLAPANAAATPADAAAAPAKRRTLEDEFADVTPFAQLLAQASSPS